MILTAAGGLQTCLADVIKVGNFSAGDLSGWELRELEGQTSYTLVKKDGRTVLKAVSKSSASAFYKEIEVDPKKYPILTWSWKIERVLAKGDARKKETDDYAARVYVVFPGTFFWSTTGLNYIWANKLPKGKALPNAYTENVIMVAVESGPAEAGRWIKEKRNLYQDYKKLFGEDPPKIGAVAVMTDSDNTKTSGTAFYGDIFLRSAK